MTTTAVLVAGQCLTSHTHPQDVGSLRSGNEGFGSRRLWSLWEMIVLHAKEFSGIIHAILATELVSRNLRGPMGEKGADIARKSSEEIQEFADRLELPLTASAARALLGRCQTLEELHKGIEQIGTIFFLETENRKFYGPTTKYVHYYEQQKLFGDSVFDAFPSANDDIFEAGACLALERPTASVMHLMRVLETALSVLGAELGVGKQNDWGAYLREIEKSLDLRTKTSKARSEDEKFFAEAAASFDRVRRAWRNPTMHPDRSYSQQRAEEILLAVKSFMAHLATRLKEASP